MYGYPMPSFTELHGIYERAMNEIVQLHKKLDEARKLAREYRDKRDELTMLLAKAKGISIKITKEPLPWDEDQ